MFKKVLKLFLTSVFALALIGCGTKQPAYVAPAKNYNLSTGESAFFDGDYTTALAHLMPYAETNHARSQAFVGYIYGDKSGKFLYPKEAYYWYSKGARNGSTMAQNNLAGIYYSGKGGIKKDYTKAYMWWSVALLNGSDFVQRNLDRLTKYLSPSEIKDGRRKAEICFSSAYLVCN